MVSTKVPLARDPELRMYDEETKIIPYEEYRKRKNRKLQIVSIVVIGNKKFVFHAKGNKLEIIEKKIKKVI
jgi:hypothetical protein